MEGTRKAYDTPFGSSVIADHPLVTPDIGPGPVPGPTRLGTSPRGIKNTLPGTQQLCGPCAGGGFCPIHSPHGHAAAGTWGVVSQGTAPTPAESLGTIVGDFLERLVGHVTARVTDDVKRELREMEDRLAMAMVHLAPEAEQYAAAMDTAYGERSGAHMHTAAEVPFVLMADMLDEEGVENSFMIDDQGVISGLVVRIAQSTRFAIVLVDSMFSTTMFRYSLDGFTSIPMTTPEIVDVFRRYKVGEDPAAEAAAQLKHDDVDPSQR